MGFKEEVLSFGTGSTLIKSKLTIRYLKVIKNYKSFL